MGKVRRALYGFAAVLLATAVLVQLFPGVVFAYGTLSDRSIRMSSSAGGATSVSYLVNFKPTSGTSINSIAVDFCGNTPILGDDCFNNNTTTPVAPTPGTHTPAFPSPAATVTGGVGVGNLTTGTWGASTINSGRTFVLTNTGSAMTFTPGTDYYFTITGVTNPTDVDDNTGGSQVGTFYSRVLTFPNAATSNYAGGYTATNLGTNIPLDAGGIALSTAAQITITAKVQERIAFCVYTTGTGNNCTSKTGTAIVLGDTNGVLDPAGPYVNTSAKYSVSTNASGGVSVRVKGPTLTSGSDTINGVGATPAQSAASTEQFGLCTYQSAGSGLTIDSMYDGSDNSPSNPPNSTACSGTTETSGTANPGGDNSAYFAFDTTTSGENIGSTYGDTISVKAAGDFSTGTLVFIGNVSNATEAGIYVSTLTFIATGVY